MRNESRMSWRLFNVLFSLAAFFGAATSGFSSIPAAEVTYSGPSIYVTAKTASSISFAWTSTSSSTVYSIRYYRHEDHTWSEEFLISGNSYLLASLPPGTYDFYFTTTCPNCNSDYVVLEDLLMG